MTQLRPDDFWYALPGLRLGSAQPASPYPVAATGPSSYGAPPRSMAAPYAPTVYPYAVNEQGEPELDHSGRPVRLDKPIVETIAFPDEEEDEWTEVAEDVLKSAGTGAVRGAVGVVGMPADLWKVVRDFGPIATARQNSSVLQWVDNKADGWNTDSLVQDLEGYVGRPLYKPKTKAGKIAATATEFGSSALIGGGLARAGAKFVAGPAVRAVGKAAGREWGKDIGRKAITDGAVKDAIGWGLVPGAAAGTAGMVLDGHPHENTGRAAAAVFGALPAAYHDWRTGSPQKWWQHALLAGNIARKVGGRGGAGYSSDRDDDADPTR